MRTAGCNLSCPGFGARYEVDGEERYGCDTYFAVDSSFAHSWIKVDDAKPLIEELRVRFDEIGYLPSIVITGGEPLIYYADSAFYGVVEWLVAQGVAITFETNGTVEIDFDRYPAYGSCIFALSIKLSNSAEPHTKRVQPKALRALSSYAKEIFMKFTIDKRLIEGSAIDEIAEIRAILPEHDIYCMPVGESRDSIWKNDRAVFEFCMKHNFNYSDRLHIRVFDTTQGV